MKAVVYDAYGPPDVVHVEEVEPPTPKDGEVLLKIRAVAVTRADCATREANRRSRRFTSAISRLPARVRRPRRRIPGRELGAEVTGVCASKNLDLIRSLGAREVIDYTRDDFTRNGETYDVIFDAVGKHSFRRSQASLRPGGRFLATDGFRNLWLSIWTPRFR